jgi:hypothetical protein
MGERVARGGGDGGEEPALVRASSACPWSPAFACAVSNEQHSGAVGGTLAAKGLPTYQISRPCKMIIYVDIYDHHNNPCYH